MVEVYFKSVTLVEEAGYLLRQQEGQVAVIIGDLVTRRVYPGPARTILERVLAGGTTRGLTVVFTAPKSVSVAGVSDERIPPLVLRAAMQTSRGLFLNANLRKGVLVPRNGELVAMLAGYPHRFTWHRRRKEPHLHVHVSVFGWSVAGQPRPLSELDLRPVKARRHLFAIQFLCALAYGLAKLGYGVVRQRGVFEIDSSARGRVLGQQREGTPLAAEMAPPLYTGPFTPPTDDQVMDRIRAGLERTFRTAYTVPVHDLLAACLVENFGVAPPRRVAKLVRHTMQLDGEQAVPGALLHQYGEAKGTLVLMRQEPQAGIGELRRSYRAALAEGPSWISLAATAQLETPPWPLVDRLFAVTEPVLCVRCGRSIADQIVRQQILDLMRLSNGVRVYVPRGKVAGWDASGGDGVRATGEHDQALRLPSVRPSDGELVWLEGASDLPEKELVLLLTAALGSGRRCVLVFGRRPPPWGHYDHYDIVRRAIPAPLLDARELGITTSGAEGGEDQGRQEPSICAVMEPDPAVTAARLFRQDARTVVACADAAEARRVAQSVREALASRGLLRADYHFLRLEPLDWSDEQKSDPSSYREGLCVVCRRPLAAFKPADRLWVVGPQDGRVRVMRRFGRHEFPALLPLHRPGDLVVCRGEWCPLSHGELLRVRQFGRTRSGARLQRDELVLVRRVEGEEVRLVGGRHAPVDFGFWDYGYAAEVERLPAGAAHLVVSRSVLETVSPLLLAGKGRTSVTFVGQTASQLEQRISGAAPIDMPQAPNGLGEARLAWKRRRRKVRAALLGIREAEPPPAMELSAKSAVLTDDSAHEPLRTAPLTAGETTAEILDTPT